MRDLVGVIPAAGRGTRAYPYTATVPKGMIPIDGKPLLQRNLELLRDQVGVREVVVVTGHHGEVIERSFGDGSALGLSIRYVRNRELERGLAHSVHLAGREIVDSGRHAVALLSDELYVGTDHARIPAFEPDGAVAACGVMHTELPRQIRRNYAVELAPDGDRVTSIVEKPEHLVNDLLGTGTYYLTPRVFELLAERLAGSPEPVVWMRFLGELIARGETVRAIPLGGRYVNVNDRDEIASANLLVRNRDFETRTVSVVTVVERDRELAAASVRRFARSSSVDELVVSARAPGEELRALVRDVRATLVESPRGTPFGDLVRRGLDAARGDILVLTQSDDSFAPHDLRKLLAYVRDADMVVGTRTTRQMVEQGSNMRGIVRLAHIVLAKLLEVLWWDRGARFTDVGCVYRAIWRSTWELTRPNVVTRGQEIYPEMVLEVLRARRRVAEIPVNYYNRDPEHEAITSPYQTVGTFLRILGTILGRSLGAQRGDRPPQA